MWLWAWFTGGGWILVAGGIVVLGLVAVAVVVGATARKRAYARDHARHAWYQPKPRPNPLASGQDFYGSMGAADEHSWGAHAFGACLPGCPWCALEVANLQPLWKAQTAADLSPEALDEPVIDLGYLSLPAELQRELESSGPGVVVPLSPGPDPERLCGPEQPHEKPAGTESAGSGHLGPRAAWVLDCYRRRHREKWAWAEPARYDYAEAAA